MSREPGAGEALDEVDEVDGIDGETVVVDRAGDAYSRPGDHGPEVEAEVEGETVVVDRRDRRDAAAEEHEATVVVRGRDRDRGRDREPTDAPDGLQAGYDLADTVIVGREASAAQALADAAAAADTILGDPDAEADTIIGDPAADAADATIVVDRGDRPGSAADRLDGADDLGAASGARDTSEPGWRSASGGRAGSSWPSDSSGSSGSGGASGISGSSGSRGVSASSGSSGSRGALADSRATPRRRLGGRRTLTPAPLEPIDLRTSVRAIGAGAIDAYRPRALPQATLPPLVETDPAPPREPSTALPSIRRRARRVAAVSLIALVAIAGAALAGIVTVTGLLLNG
jgi:hypothetical protein